jgi:hypothetical protein
VANHLRAQRIAVAGAASQQLDQYSRIDARLHASEQSLDGQRQIGSR